MKFIINSLDKVQLLQALYAIGSQKGMGNFVEKEPMSKEDAKYLLKKMNSERFGIIDYYNGVPLKFEYSNDQDGNYVVDSFSYDYRHGKYSFLEALLLSFDLEQIGMVKINYKEHLPSAFPPESDYQKELTALLANTIKTTKEPLFFGVNYIFLNGTAFVPKQLRELSI